MKLLLLFLSLALPLLGAPRLSLGDQVIEPKTKIELIFDKAMVTPDTVGQTIENSILTINPVWKTKLNWRAQNIATIVPQEAPKVATNYEFSLSRDLKAVDGTVVPAQKFKAAQSEPFQVVRSLRNGSVRTGESILMFNDNVSPTSTAAFFQFVSPKTEEQEEQIVAARTRKATWGDLRSRYYYQPSWQERFTGKNRRYGNPVPGPTEIIEHALVVEPVTPLPIGTLWSLRRLSSLPNAAGSASIDKINHYALGNVVPFTTKLIVPVTAPDQPRTIRITFNQPLPGDLKPAEFLKHLKFGNPVEKLEAHLDYRHTTVTLQGDFGSRDNYHLTLSNSLFSEDRLRLEKTIVQDLRFTRLAPNILLPSRDEAQLARGSRTYQIQSINNRSLRLRIKRLSPKDLIRASLGYRHYTGDGPNSERIKKRIPIPFELVTGKVVADEVIEIDADIDTTHTHTFNWSKYLPKNQTGGAFFVSVTGATADHPDLKNANNKVVQSLVQLTDIGLAWKLTDDSAFLYAYSCETGKALPGVEFALFGEDAAPFKKAVADEDGTASFTRNEEHRLLRASYKGDLLILPFDNSLSTVSMWRFPINYDWGSAPADKRIVELFTDRSLYRPGETVHLKGIVRKLKKDELRLPMSINPKLVLMDPMRRVIVERDLTLSTSGTFDFTHTLPDTTVGKYYFKLTWPDELEAAEELEDYWAKRAAKQSASFSYYFSVQEFKRNTFAVNSSLTEELAYKLSAKYFQGTPVAKGKVRWFFRTDPTGFYPADYRDFLFGNHRGYDPDYWNHYFGYSGDGGDLDRQGRHSENGETELSEDGKLAIDFAIPALKFPTPRRATVQTEVMDANSQTLSTNAGTTLHSSGFYLGILRQDQITRVSNEIPFKVVAVTQKGKLHTEPVTATLTVEREVNKQIKSKAPNGRIIVKNDASIVPVTTREITLPNGKIDLPFTPTESGKHFFTLTSKDASGRLIKTVITRQIYGTNEYPWAYEAGMRIKLVPEKRRYQPGETARILVLSPIEGEALITVEHKDVARKFRKQLTLENPVIEIPLNEDDAPNAFVSVLIIKGSADSKRKDPEPQLRLGYCELTVDPAKSRLTIDLATTQSETRPGDIIEVSGNVTDYKGKPVSAAEITFYAVDEGTLAVMGYDNPDPLSTFHQPRLMSLKNGTSLTNFIPESLDAREFGNKGFIIGGGEADAFAASDGGGEEEEKSRSDFNPTAAWMPALVTGSDGTFSARFKAPDTLTRYRLIAVASHGSSRFGNGISEAVVNKPFMLEPSPPAFAHEGDRIRSKALLQNTTDNAGTWKVELKLDSTTTANKTLMTEIDVPAKGQATVEFAVIFANTGSAKWQWSAEPVALANRDLPPALKQNLSDSVESTFEVRYPMPLLREVQFVTFNDPARKFNLLEGFSEELIAGRGHLEVEFARSRLLEAGGAIDYLLRYPYGCAEQTTSSTIPWIAAKNLRHLAPGFQRQSVTQIDKAIQAGADRLLGMQTSDGGIGYWSGNSSSSNWASSYAGLGLILCKEAGADVPQSSLDRLAGYLSSNLRGLSGTKTGYDYENYARGLYVLARLGKAENAYHSKLLEKADQIPQSARAFLALAMHTAKQEGAEELLGMDGETGNNSGYWMTYRNADAMSLFAWSTIKPNSKGCEDNLSKLLAKRSPRGHWRTTWANAWSLLAMGAYAQAHEISQKDIELLVETSDGTKKIVIPKDKPSRTLKLPLEGGFKLLASSSEKTYVYSVIAAKPKIAPVQPVSKNGLSIIRNYERVQSDGSTEKLQDPKIGDLVKVTLTVSLPDKSMRYLAIDDPLPSSFQAVNSDFGSQAGRVKDKNHWSISHQEVRLDRVLFFVDNPRRSSNVTMSYHARVTHDGENFVPSTKVEEMYDPSSYALGATQTLSVK
ncbi:MG2 domain-containing protein [Akkermansiaceae bacterium]|nr:MG2 domain-containing protein [Akkermansiaceae bacterium]